MYSLGFKVSEAAVGLVAGPYVVNLDTFFVAPLLARSGDKSMALTFARQIRRASCRAWKARRIWVASKMTRHP